MSLTRAWQESYPTDENYGYELDDYQRQIRQDVRERLAVQHKVYSDETGHSDVGEHTPGECNVAYIGDKADFPTPATSNPGCLAVATDESNQIYYWTGSDWAKIQEVVLTSGDQTIGGAKTFSGTLTAASPVINTGISGTAVLDEDDMLSDSDIQLATQQSIKAYIDNSINNCLSIYSNQDSDGNAMLGNHAYLAQTPGSVSAFAEIGVSEHLSGYVGSNSNPSGAGTLIQNTEGYTETDQNQSIFFAVAKGQYFEVTSGGGSPTILWQSIGTLAKPIDQD
jgi:hypothetical protein